MKFRKNLLIIFLLSFTLLLSACKMDNQNSDKTETKEETIVEKESVIENKEESAEEVLSEPDKKNILASNNPTQERLNFLQEKALHYYWHGGDLKEAEKEFFQGITLKGDQNVVEAIYEEMITLDPLNTDYQRSLASSKLLNNKLEEAVAIFNNVAKKEPNNYDALMQAYAYGGVLNDNFDEE